MRRVIGGMGVVTPPLGGEARGFCAAWGFRDLPFDPRRAMMARIIDIRRCFAGKPKADLRVDEAIPEAGGLGQ